MSRLDRIGLVGLRRWLNTPINVEEYEVRYARLLRVIENGEGTTAWRLDKLSVDDLRFIIAYTKKKGPNRRACGQD